MPLSLLSNAPHELAKALSVGTQCSHRSHICSSAPSSRLTKPDPRIYAAAIARLDIAACQHRLRRRSPGERRRGRGRTGLVAIHYAGHQDIAAIQAALRA